MATKKPGLYANIHAKQERIAHGSDEKMRKTGDKGAPKAENFEQAAKSEKPAAKKSAGDKPAAKKSSDKPTAKKSLAKKSAVKKASVKKAAAK